jgi:oligoendopeptidase F
VPAIKATRTHPYRYLSDSLDVADPQAIARLYDELDGRDISTRQALEDFIFDWDELYAVLYEANVEAYIDMTSDTTNQSFQERYSHISENVVPLMDQRNFKLKQKMLESPALDELGSEYDVFLRQVRAEVRVFREENVALQTEERRLNQEFQQISGRRKAEFRGQTYTPAQLQPFLEETDRQTREEAWRALSEAKLADATILDELYDQMYELRQQVARNAGFSNYRDYRFQELKRFDYTPQDCEAFHEAVEKHVVPVATEDNARRKRLLGIDSLRPWDLSVDAEGYEPLRPFSDVEKLKEGCERIFQQIDPELGGYFRQMMQDNLLDLENRAGKAPGGYMEALPSKRVPFIYMNAVGTHRDVETLLHEGGHSFHFFLSRELPLLNYQMTGIGAEFAEVASMTMEYLCQPYLSAFYNEEEIRRIREEKIRDSMQWFPFMAMIDAFQHWVYTAEDHGPEARRARWAELERRFRPDLDSSGLEQYRDIGWQYLHVFSYPFYFIEYAIAQLAAMRIWLNSLEDERGAVEAYKRGLALGGSRPLPELFKAAGAEFGLDERTVKSIVDGALAQMSR